MPLTTITAAPYKNNLPAGHENLLSEQSQAILEEHGLTVCIAQQQEPHKLSLPIGFVSIAAVMPAFPNKGVVEESLIASTNEETVKNIVSDASKMRLDEEAPITHHWAVYLIDSCGRKSYVVDDSLNGKKDAVLAGVVFGCENDVKKLGKTPEAQARFINSQLAVATMFVNNDLLQIIWRKEGIALDIESVVLKEKGYIDRKIRNKTRNISLRRPAPVMDFSQFV